MDRLILGEPELVVKNGKPTAVILNIRVFKEILERIEDAEDLAELRALRKKKLKFRKFKEFLSSYSHV